MGKTVWIVDFKLGRNIQNTVPFVPGVLVRLSGDYHFWNGLPYIKRVLIVIYGDVPRIGTWSQREKLESMHEFMNAGLKSQAVRGVRPDQLSVHIVERNAVASTSNRSCHFQAKPNSDRTKRSDAVWGFEILPIDSPPKKAGFKLFGMAPRRDGSIHT